MVNKILLEPVTHDELKDLINLVTKFLECVEDLFKNNIISEELYEQLTNNKKQFLKDFNK